MSESLKVAWSEALSTGDRATDVQHKYLIDIINELAEAIRKAARERNISFFIVDLHAYGVGI